MKMLTVFDPAMCCSTGVCGSDVDQVLVNFSADVQWLKGRGVQIERYNLAQQPMSFVENEKAKAFLEASGAEGLPLLLLDGETVMAGRYPKRAELARWFGIPLEKVGLASTSCCGGKTSGTVAKLAMRQPFVLFKGLTFQKLCLPGAFRPGDHHNKMLRPGLCVVHASPQYL